MKPRRSPKEVAAYIEGSLAAIDSVLAGMSVLPDVIDKDHMIHLLQNLQVCIQVEGAQVDPAP